MTVIKCFSLKSSGNWRKSRKNVLKVCLYRKSVNEVCPTPPWWGCTPYFRMRFFNNLNRTCKCTPPWWRANSIPWNPLNPCEISRTPRDVLQDVTRHLVDPSCHETSCAKRLVFFLFVDTSCVISLWCLQCFVAKGFTRTFFDMFREWMDIEK